MIETLQHIIRISARRDRTETNAALMDAIEDLFQPLSATLYQYYPNLKQPMVFNCAGFDEDGPYARNAYLPDRHHCQRLDALPHLGRCLREGGIVMDVLTDGRQRLVFPVGDPGNPSHLVEITCFEEFATDSRVSLMGLIEYFSNHIALLNYGETDTLTGLASRKTFEKHLFELLGQTHRRHVEQRDERRHEPSGESHHWLAVCDIDHFKAINDNFSHLIGDQVLVMMGQLIRQSFRFDDQLFRFGGEEFIVVLQPSTSHAAQCAFERFRQQVSAHRFGQVDRVTLSIGYTRISPFDTPVDIIDRADEALYYAKEHGRNRVDNYEALVDSGALPEARLHSGDTGSA